MVLNELYNHIHLAFERVFIRYAECLQCGLNLIESLASLKLHTHLSHSQFMSC